MIGKTNPVKIDKWPEANKEVEILVPPFCGAYFEITAYEQKQPFFLHATCTD